MASHNSSSVHKKVVAFKIKTNNILHYEACLRGSMYNFRYKNINVMFFLSYSIKEYIKINS